MSPQLSVLLNVYIFLSVLLNEVLCQPILNPPPSPCPDIYYYESDGYDWHGIIDAPDPPPYGSQMTLKVRMSLKAQLPSDYVGKIVLGEDRPIILDRIEKNWPIKYKVHFPLRSPLPNVISIIFDGRLICSGPVAVGRLVTAIDLEHTLHSGQSAIKNSPQNELVFSGPTPIQKYALNKNELGNRFDVTDDSSIVFNPIEPTVYNSLLRDHGMCGTTSSINPLVVGGDATSKEDWPWLVAIFMKRTRGLDFTCAGNLISDRLILTAAHCVKDNNKEDKKPSDMVVRLGVYNLQDWTEESAVTKSVSRIRTRKDYDEGVILNADIAVLVLAQIVKFSNRIRPVCLWKGDDNQDLVYGSIGTVVGWGKDETGAVITPEPKAVNIPIVSTSTCR